MGAEQDGGLSGGVLRIHRPNDVGQGHRNTVVELGDGFAGWRRNERGLVGVIKGRGEEGFEEGRSSGGWMMETGDAVPFPYPVVGPDPDARPQILDGRFQGLETPIEGAAVKVIDRRV